MSFLDTINTIEDLPTGQLAPGTFYWLHGVKQGKHPGTFYVKSAEVGDTPGAPWVEDARFDNETGYAAPELRIAIIGYRSQWYTQAEQGKPKTWLPGYQAGVGAKKHTDFLCLVEGIDMPMVLSADGMNKEKPLIDIIKSYRDGLLTQASRMAKKALPLWTFWLPIANKRTADGKTAYIEAADASGKTYGSVVTPPTLYLPSDAMESCFVGEALLRKGAAVWAEYSGWFDAKRTPPQVVEGVVEEVRMIEAPRNVPQGITNEEVDLPF